MILTKDRSWFDEGLLDRALRLVKCRSGSGDIQDCKNIGSAAACDRECSHTGVVCCLRVQLSSSIRECPVDPSHGGVHRRAILVLHRHLRLNPDRCRRKCDTSAEALAATTNRHFRPSVTCDFVVLKIALRSRYFHTSEKVASRKIIRNDKWQ